MLGRVLLIIAIILLIVMVVLYFLGKKAQKKKEEQDAQVAAAAQSVSMLIIDKKRMRLKDAGLPQQVLAQTNKLMQRSKLPIVKAKVGSRVMTFIADEKIFEEIPVKKEVKATVSYRCTWSSWSIGKASGQAEKESSCKASGTVRQSKQEASGRKTEEIKHKRTAVMWQFFFISFRVCEILCFAVDLPSGEYGSLQHAHC